MTSQTRYHLSRWASLAGLVAAVGLLVIPARAAVILSSTDPHASNFSHSFSPGHGEMMPPQFYDQCSLSFADSTAHLAQNSSVSFTLNAPAGYQFVVHTAPGQTYGRIEFRVWYGSANYGSPWATYSTPTLTFGGLNGTEPSYSGGWVIIPTQGASGNGSVMAAQPSMAVSSGFSFTSLTCTFDYSNSGMADVPLGSFNPSESWLTYYGNIASGGGDPGTMLELSPIPEPGTTGVLAVALLALIIGGRTWHQRRKAAIQH